MSRRLLNAVTATGSSAAVRIADVVGGPADEANVQLRGMAFGTFGGTSLQFEVADQAQTEWMNAGSAVTAEGSVDLGRWPVTWYIRATLTGGAPNPVTAEVG